MDLLFFHNCITDSSGGGDCSAVSEELFAGIARVVSELSSSRHEHDHDTGYFS